MPELTFLGLLGTLLRAHLAELRRQDREAGYTAETVIIIAALAVAALAAVGLIASKVRAKANSINLG